MLHRKFIWSGIIVLLLFPAAHFAQAFDLKSVQEKIDLQGKEWSVADNPILYLTDMERRSMLLYGHPQIFPGDNFYLPESSKELPASLDWRNKEGNYITSIKNQALCGSCWAFAAIAQLEAQDAVTNMKNNPDTDLSEQFLVSCFSGGDCSGGWHNEAFDFIIENGVPDDSCFPYIEANGNCASACEDWETRTMTLDKWSWVTTENNSDTELIKSALLEGPLATLMEIYDDFYGYGSGVYDPVGFPENGLHVVLLIGWNDGEQAWIAKNSWSEEWGIKGFFKIKYGAATIGKYTTKIEVPLTTCLIGGETFHPGPNPENACLICDPLQNLYDWTIIENGEPCDDGLYCNGTDICGAGTCSIHSGDPCPADEFWCNGAEYCDEENEKCQTTENPCQYNERCDETAQECTSSNGNTGMDDDDVRDDEEEEGNSCGC